MSDSCVELQLSDEELVQRAQSGCHESFTTLYNRYSGYVRQTAYSILRQSDQLDDLVQEVFVEAYAGLSKFRGDSQFFTWLTRIARTRVYMYLRYHTNHPTEDLGFHLEYCTSLDDQEKSLRDHQDRAILSKLIAELPTIYRKVAQLQIDNHTKRQIAETLELSEEAVNSRQRRIVEMLPQRWRDYQTDYERSVEFVGVDYED